VELIGSIQGSTVSNASDRCARPWKDRFSPYVFHKDYQPYDK